MKYDIFNLCTGAEETIEAVIDLTLDGGVCIVRPVRDTEGITATGGNEALRIIIPMSNTNARTVSGKLYSALAYSNLLLTSYALIGQWCEDLFVNDKYEGTVESMTALQFYKLLEMISNMDNSGTYTCATDLYTSNQSVESALCQMTGGLVPTDLGDFYNMLTHLQVELCTEPYLTYTQHYSLRTKNELIEHLLENVVRPANTRTTHELRDAVKARMSPQ